uniref:Coiled-coil domain-containing protein 83 n=1 Tax=Leptobrachium leishanense TaxID=445787 RepID=A0A8C5LUT5_9ANUR
MGKKDKKDGKKSKKGKKKKKQGRDGSKEDKMTCAEALLAYQIKIKESELGELAAEYKQDEEKNARYKERNERLKAEQLGHIKDLLREAKAQEKELAKKETVNGEQVDAEIREKWEYIREKERLFEDLRSEINRQDKEIVDKQLQRDYWSDYKNVVSKEHAKQIHVLQQELSSMEQGYNEVSDFFRKNLETLKSEIDRRKEKLMGETREMAAEEAVKNLDVESRKEIKENDWLKKEVTAYRKYVHDLEETVYKIEQENLRMLSHLFEGRPSDLKMARNTFLNRTVNVEIPEDGPLTRDIVTLEPELRSGLLEGIEKKGFSMDCPSEDDSPPPEIVQLLHKDEKDLQEYVERSAAQPKLLRIQGRAMPMHSQEELVESLQQDFPGARDQEKWPVTPRMIYSAIS